MRPSAPRPWGVVGALLLLRLGPGQGVGGPGLGALSLGPRKAGPVWCPHPSHPSTWNPALVALKDLGAGTQIGVDGVR